MTANLKTPAQPATVGAAPAVEPDAMSFSDALTAVGSMTEHVGKKSKAGSEEDTDKNKGSKPDTSPEQLLFTLPSLLPSVPERQPIRLNESGGSEIPSLPGSVALPVEPAEPQAETVQQQPNGTGASIPSANDDASYNVADTNPVQPSALSAKNAKPSMEPVTPPVLDHAVQIAPAETSRPAKSADISHRAADTVAAPPAVDAQTQAATAQPLTVAADTTITSLVAETTSWAAKAPPTEQGGIGKLLSGTRPAADTPKAPRNESGKPADALLATTNAAPESPVNISGKSVTAVEMHGVERDAGDVSEDVAVNKRKGVGITATPMFSVDTHSAPQADGASLASKEVGQTSTAANQNHQAPSKSEVPEAQAAQPQPWVPAQPSALGVSSARLIQSMQQTGMRVALHSSEFGNISIHSVASPQGQISSEITLGHTGLADLIGAHIAGSQEKAIAAHNLSVRVDTSTPTAADSSGSFSQGSNHKDSQDGATRRGILRRNDSADVWSAPIASPAVQVPIVRDGRLDVRA